MDEWLHRWILSEPSFSHEANKALVLYDDQEIYVEGLIKFILDVKAGKF